MRVRPDQLGRRHDRHDDPVGRVRAVVVPDVDVERGDPAVVVVADGDLLALLPLVRRGDEVLAPVLGPLHLPAQRDGGHRHQQLLGPRVHDLHAEAAADVGRDHLDLLQRQLELGRDRPRAPTSRPGCEVYTRSDESSASHRACTPLPSIGMQALRSMYWVKRQRVRRRGQRGLDVPGLLVVAGGDVVGDLGVHRRAGRAGGVHADDDRQLLVGDDDPVADVLGDVPVGGHDHDDGLADVVHLAVGQRVAGARGACSCGWGMSTGSGSAIGPVQVLVGVDRDDALDVQGGVDVDVDDRGRARAGCARRRRPARRARCRRGSGPGR